MIKLSEQQIKEITSILDCGLTCLIDRRTGQVKNVLNAENLEISEDGSWENVLSDSGKTGYDYLEISPMPPRDAFLIMEDFVETVGNVDLQTKLSNSLNKKHPFKNFKWEIDRSGDYRQKWFDFKEIRYIDWVKNYLDKFNSKEK
jgi:hypothetical protein